MATHENVNKVALERAWNDIEPKIKAGVGGGALVTAAVYVASLYNFTLSPVELTTIGVLGTLIAGYIKKSSITTVSLIESQAAAVQAAPVDDTPVTFDPPQV